MLASSKTQRVDLRISPAAKEMIQAAARAQDKTVSEFLLDSGLTSAAETLADRRLFILDDAQWQAFQAALDAPPRARPRLSRLMKTARRACCARTRPACRCASWARTSRRCA